MNRIISQHTLPIDENSGRSEPRLKLNSRGFLFLSVVVVGDQVIASFEEETCGGGANESFFIYKVGETLRTRGEHLATFVYKNEVHYLYGKRTNQ